MKRRLSQVFFPAIGLLAGLAGSYLFSPTFMGIRVFTFFEWFSRFTDVPRGVGTIAVSAFVGLALGILTSANVCWLRTRTAKSAE